MGRNLTGVMSTTEALRLDISDLLKKGVIQKGETTEAHLSWSTGAEIYLTGVYTDTERYILLSYQVTGADKEPVDLEYKIYLGAVPSNLGKGEVLYLVCPKLRDYCRVLYLAYGSKYFMSRKAYSSIYRLRLYYPQQRTSNIERLWSRTARKEGQLNKINAMRESHTYNGNKTKRAKRKEKILDQLWDLERRREEELLRYVNKRWGVDNNL
jgi:hypothetical protein